VQLLAVLSEALLGFEEVRMVLLLLPAVGEQTVVLILAALSVLVDEAVGTPLLAEVLGVVEYVGLAAVVLPVVGVYARLAVVVILTIGAPDCFEVEDIEIIIRQVLLNKLDRELISRVSEAAVVSILTRRWGP